MAELFRIKTEHVSLIWSGPRPRSSEPHPVGRLRILPKRRDFVLLEGTYRDEVPSENVCDVSELGGPPLFEQTTYDLWLASQHGERVELRHRDPLLLANLHTTYNQAHIYGHINFAGQVGLSRFSVLVDGRPEFDLEVEVFSSKLNYRADYAAMLGDVNSLVSGLALEFLRATHQLGTAIAGRQESRLEWLALLRHLLADLEKALHYVNQHSVRGLRREYKPERVEKLRRSDARLRKAVQTGKGQGPLVCLNSGIPVRRQLPEQRPVPTLDTPEHRWLALQLRRIRQELSRTAQEEWRRQSQIKNTAGHSSISTRDKHALQEIEQLERRITNLAWLPPFVEASGLPPPGFSSLQLQGAPGYREAYRTILTLRQGLSIRGGPIELSIKDIHVLYEYWCFLALLQAVSEVLNTTIPAERVLEVYGEGLRIQLQQGRTQSVPFDLSGGRHLEVTYNPSFQGTESLLPQNPDFVFTFTDPYWPKVRLVLDAKYRVQHDEASIKRFGVASPPPDAINVLHRYRDAILESGMDYNQQLETNGTSETKRTVVEGAVLYPLDADSAQNFDQTPLWDSLTRLGIGALPFLPGSTLWVKKWLSNVLQRCGWKIADSVIPHVAELSKVHWKKAAEEIVLVAVLRGGQELNHLEWVKQEQKYYTRLTPSQPRQYHAKVVTFYLPASARKQGLPGAVTHWAEVKDIEVLPRRQINTHWPARRNPDELQVLYTLGPLQSLSKEIVNQNPEEKGQRFSNNRWSSRLALSRATHVNELLLESAAEWELYESLCAKGMQFKLKAIPPGRKNQNGNTGRAWFIIGNCRCRFFGGHQFEFSIGNGYVREFPLKEIIREMEKQEKLYDKEK